MTTDKASDRMWKEYAQDHRGVVLRIEPNVAKDSKFQKFKPVIYQEKRPSIYEKTLDFAKEGPFGDQTARARSVMDRIICAKTNGYEFERAGCRIALKLLRLRGRAPSRLPLAAGRGSRPSFIKGAPYISTALRLPYDWAILEWRGASVVKRGSVDEEGGSFDDTFGAQARPRRRS